MLSFAIRRLNLFFFTMVSLTLMAFSVNFLFPGDSLINITGEVNANQQQLEHLGEVYQRSSSLVEQYLAYLKQVFSGNLGISMSSQRDINEEIMGFLPATVELSIAALFIATIIGVPLGFTAAIKHTKPTDKAILAIAMIGYSMPVFWLALLAITLFSIELSWLPSSGQLNLLFEIEQITGFLFIDIILGDSPYKWQALKDAYLHIILPAIVVAAAPTTIIIRLARTAMLDVLNTNYIKAARAKGLSTRQIIFRHGIRNALLNIIRNVGLQFANLITIAMITEVIFDWPGIGRFLIEAIYQRDYTAIQAGLLVLSSFIFFVNIITDFIYAALNPLARSKKNYGA